VAAGAHDFERCFDLSKRRRRHLLILLALGKAHQRHALIASRTHHPVERHPLAGYYASFDPKGGEISVVYQLIPPILFQLKTATGKLYSMYAAAFSVNFSGADFSVISR
jgi:hypothetical protein